MNVSLQVYTNWAAAQKTDDAVFQNQELGKDLAADFLSRIRADCGAVEDRQLPANIRQAIADAQVVSGKPLTARAIKQVSTAALSWERDVNRLGNRIVDSGLSAAAKDIYLEALASATTSEQLGELEKVVFGPSSEEADLPEPYQFGTDELFPKLGDKGLFFTQSRGANTCFAMSVMNGCSHSKKLSKHFNEKFADMSQGLKLHYPGGGVKPVTIGKQYDDLPDGKLGAFENAVVNYMCEVDPTYRNEMSGHNQHPDQSLPLGNAVTFGKAIGLVQSQPDVMISDEEEIPDVLGRGLEVENYESVRNRIDRQLRQGGVVTMNVGGGHYVAITEIEEDDVTVVDSKGQMTGIHDLRTFTGKVSDDYSGSYVFSFLDLPSENASYRSLASAPDID